EGVAERPRQTSSMPPGRGVVLVVDDDDAVRKTTARLVRSLGYEVLDAGSGAQALARSAAPDRRIDILLCDIVMPGEDGRDLAGQLAKSRPELKIVFMSGYSKDLQDPRLTGASFLQKPFGRQELAQKLAEATGTTGDVTA
ncbi:MAG TPA: response regulator, partial [Polyangiaceae bacterium]|nr:response regulator [Polyangiaceae bacterium]